MPQVGETRSDGKVYTGPKYGWQSPGSAFKKTPAGKPGEEKTIGGVTKVYTGPKFGWQTKATVKARQQPTPTPPAAPAPTPPAAPTPAPAPGRQPAPSPAPAPSRQPAPPRAPATPAATPQSSALADYTKAAAAARKSGDPAEMAKARDMGMEIWAKKYKTTLAPKVQPGQSGYETIQKTINPPAPAPAQAPGNEKPGYSGPPTPGTETAPVKPTTKPEDKPVKKTVNSSYEYDAYDLVLEYLFSSGQADTISEAHYVMMQMDAEHIQNIISEQMPVVAQRPQLSARAQALQSGGPSGGPRQLGGGAAAPRPVPVAAAAPAPRPVPVAAAAPAAAAVRPAGAPAAAAPAPRQSLAAQAAELRDMQRASQLRQQGQNVMGSNITSVRQSLDAARARDNVQAPAGTALAAQQRSQMQRAGALGAAANPAVRQKLNLPIKAATPTQAIKAAGNPSAVASGSVAQASNKFAAAPRPITQNPSGGFSTKPGDGKPYKDGPLWDSDQKPEDVKVNPKPAPTGGYSTRPGDGKPYADGPLWGPGSSDSPSSPARPKPKPAPRDEPLW